MLGVTYGYLNYGFDSGVDHTRNQTGTCLATRRITPVGAERPGRRDGGDTGRAGEQSGRQRLSQSDPRAARRRVRSEPALEPRVDCFRRTERRYRGSGEQVSANGVRVPTRPGHQRDLATARVERRIGHRAVEDGCTTGARVLRKDAKRRLTQRELPRQHAAGGGAKPEQLPAE